MSYIVYMDNMQLPVTPGKLQTKINSQNETLTLIDEGEINQLKKAGLTEIEFDALLPNVRYPFAAYKNGFAKADVFLEKLEKLKTGQKPFQFIVTRNLPKKGKLFSTNMKVALESYTIKEEAKDGFDVTVSIRLKQYRDYGTKTCKIMPAETASKKSAGKAKASVSRKRSAKKATKNKSYTVKKGDCLWNIAKKYYGDGSKYTKIYQANKSKIKNPNLIYPGQVLTIPA